MKKKTVLIAVITIIALLLTAFLIKSAYARRQQEAIAAGQPAIIISHDKTVLPSFVYNFDSISSETLAGEKHYSFSFPEQDNPLKVIELSADIVHAVVRNISYTFIDGRAWTVAEMQILETYKGGLIKDDIISVYYPGGYVSVKDYNEHYEKNTPVRENKFYKSIADGAPSPFLMQEEIFFLSSDSSRYNLPEGTYTLSCGNSSICNIVEEGRIFWMGTDFLTEDLLNMLNKKET